MTTNHYVGAAMGVIVLLMISLFFGDRAYRKWQRENYPDKDRVLSKTEAKYLEDAKTSLREFAGAQDFPKFKYALYSFLPLPLMILSWAALFALNQYLASALQKTNITAKPADEALFIHANPFGVSGVIGIFAGILMAGWLSYFLFEKNQKFVTWMMLNQSSRKGEHPISIAKRRGAKIEPQLRARKLDALSKFSPAEFLFGIYQHQKNLCGIGVILLMIPTLIFFYFDLRDQKVYSSDAITTEAYWTGAETTIPYSDLTHISLNCSTGSRNSLSVGVTLKKGEETIDRIDLIDNRDPEALKKIQNLDALWRSQGMVFQKSVRRQKGNMLKSRYLQKCFSRLDNYTRDQKEMMRRILHADEFRAE